MNTFVFGNLKSQPCVCRQYCITANCFFLITGYSDVGAVLAQWSVPLTYKAAGLSTLPCKTNSKSFMWNFLSVARKTMLAYVSDVLWHVMWDRWVKKGKSWLYSSYNIKEQISFLMLLIYSAAFEMSSKCKAKPNKWLQQKSFSKECMYKRILSALEYLEGNGLFYHKDTTEGDYVNSMLTFGALQCFFKIFSYHDV